MQSHCPLHHPSSLPTFDHVHFPWFIIRLVICRPEEKKRGENYLRPFYTFTDRITDHPGSSLRDHPCYLRHYRVYTGEASGEILGVPAYPGKKLSLLNFSSRSSRMKTIRPLPCRHRVPPCSRRIHPGQSV